MRCVAHKRSCEYCRTTTTARKKACDRSADFQLFFSVSLFVFLCSTEHGCARVRNSGLQLRLESRRDLSSWRQLAAPLGRVCSAYIVDTLRRLLLLRRALASCRPCWAVAIQARRQRAFALRPLALVILEVLLFTRSQPDQMLRCYRAGKTRACCLV